MIYTLPIRFDSNINIISNTFPIATCRFSKTNGYDANGIRVTNLVGFDTNDFMKQCPNCGRIMPASIFGLRNMPDGQHDQSNCPDCRSNY